MSPSQQEMLNRLFEESFGIVLPEGRNITLKEVENFVGTFMRFEQNELTPDEYIDILRGMGKD